MKIRRYPNTSLIRRAALIVLPVAILSGIALYSLREDKVSTEKEARDRAQSAGARASDAAAARRRSQTLLDAMPANEPKSKWEAQERYRAILRSRFVSGYVLERSPVFRPKAGDSAEMGQVVRYHNQTASYRCCSNKNVLHIYRLSSCPQSGEDVAGNQCFLQPQVQDLNPGEDFPLDAPPKRPRVLAPHRAMPQLHDADTRGEQVFDWMFA